MGTITSILRDGVKERLGSIRLAPPRLPIRDELAALRHRLARVTSRPEIRTDVVARAELLQLIAGTLEDIKVAMLAGATDLTPEEIAEACRVDVRGPGVSGPVASGEWPVASGGEHGLSRTPGSSPLTTGHSPLTGEGG